MRQTAAHGASRGLLSTAAPQLGLPRPRLTANESTHRTATLRATLASPRTGAIVAALDLNLLPSMKRTLLLAAAMLAAGLAHAALKPGDRLSSYNINDAATGKVYCLV